MASLAQWTWTWVSLRSWWCLACCSQWGCKELDTTEWLNWTELSLYETLAPNLRVGMMSECQVWAPSGFESREKESRTFLVAQWVRIRLPMQVIRVQFLAQEDSTRLGAAKSMCHNYSGLHTLGPVSHNQWAAMPELLKSTDLEPVLHSKRRHHNEKPMCCN